MLRGDMVGPCGLEPQTSTVSRWRSSQLSYGPISTESLSHRAGTADLTAAPQPALANRAVGPPRFNFQVA